MDRLQLPRAFGGLVAGRLLGSVPRAFGGLKRDRRQLPRAFGGLVAGRLLGSEPRAFGGLKRERRQLPRADGLVPDWDTTGGHYIAPGLRRRWLYGIDRRQHGCWV